MGYGTAIYSSKGTQNTQSCLSPYAEFGGFIYKKTTISNSDGVQFVSFHGFNGTPSRDPKKLAAHVGTAVALLHKGTFFENVEECWNQKNNTIIQRTPASKREVC
mmetsp:Transcript_39425/g.77563  ORF Transcript_39425/g.77563 Transcript_39425/m.77563 type:complete len:105 (+) Transcript_39425:1330-1644(+)